MPATYENLSLPALVDQFPLHATRFDPPSDVPAKACAVILCATGINAKFYRDFSRWLSQNAIGVITFDYRYTGLSWPAEQLPLVSGPNSSNETRKAARQAVPHDVRITTHWMERDAAAAIRFASKAWLGVPLTCFGHSLGGMYMPIIYNERPLISRYINVCGGNKWVGNYDNPLEMLSMFKKNVYDPLEKDKIFYGSRAGLGEDLPYGPGTEWVRAFMSPRSVQETPRAEQITREIDKPFLVIGFEDDHFCHKNLILKLMGQFSHSDRRKISLWIDSAAQSPTWPPCGHVHSFIASPPPKLNSNEPHQLTRTESIWLVYRDWILYGTVDESLGEFRRWQPEDEFDPLERAEWEYSLEDGEPPRRPIVRDEKQGQRTKGKL